MSLYASMGSGTRTVDTHRQFLDYIKLHVYTDGYLDREEERKILEEATRMGIGFDAGLSILRDQAQSQGWVIERELETSARDMLEQFSRSGGVVDQKEFNDVVEWLRSGSKNHISQPDAQRRIKKMMLEAGWKAKEGGLFGSKWFSAIA
jgi:hypothetical protein